MNGPHALSPCAELVRRHDPDRFLTVLFAPPARREALFVLYAFNHELARARAVVSEPMLALIRLQWWREVVQGTAKRHEVATNLYHLKAIGLRWEYPREEWPAMYGLEHTPVAVSLVPATWH